MFYCLILLTLVAHVSGAIGGLIGTMQSAGANGTFVCNGRPEANVLVKLYDQDRLLSTDDLMGETKTDRNGYFRVVGKIREISTIDPKLNVYHDCNDGWKPCQRKFSIKLPDSYVTNGDIPRRIYDVGRMELAGKMPGEERDCLH
ncbi:unnamed protein product [Dracunculus medinensis]|uniref:Transthyretin-like family protein n=1 Tax=Dracunculus medinensis TaxID=318479 RepID=A0A0N4UAB4_DRAME|nr:unnamed protein product [Dracunculus medinensis]